MRFQEENEVLRAIKKPKNSANIEIGQIYESELRIFTEAKTASELFPEKGWQNFKKYMRATLSEQQFIELQKYILYPLSSISITKAVLSNIYKVFDAGNSFFNISTSKKNGGDRLNKIFEKINLVPWIEKTGKKVLKNKPNTIIVIDKNEDNEPFILEVDNNRLLDYSLKKDNISLGHIVFKHSEKLDDNGILEKRYAVYDELAYYVVLERENNFIVETTAKHNLGYCPARFFLEGTLNNKNNICRESPLSLAISKIKEWQLFDIYKLYTDHYAPFPVIEMVRAECGDHKCNKGLLKIIVDSVNSVGENIQVEKFVKCKKCSEANKIGIGGKIMIDNIGGEENENSGKFRMISNDVKNLEYLEDKLQKIETYIKNSVVGVDDTVSKEAINELQVKGSFENRTNVLLNLKNNLDNVYKWVAMTVAQLVNLKNDTLEISANFGTEWYLVTEDNLQDRFKKSLENKVPIEEVNNIYLQLLETKYKGNTKKLERLKILNLLNPLPFLNIGEKKEQLANGIITLKEFIISEKINTFVKRFELDNGGIAEFGESLKFEAKIKKLNTFIEKYADEQINNREPEPVGSEPT